jgi:hypothetical protein
MPISYPLYHATGPSVTNPVRVPAPGGRPESGACVRRVHDQHGQHPCQPFREPQLPQQTGTTSAMSSPRPASLVWYSGSWSNATVITSRRLNRGRLLACAVIRTRSRTRRGHTPEQGVPVPSAVQLRVVRARNSRRTACGRGRVRAAWRRQTKCMLDSVSFIKPIGLENEHPGYTSEVRGATTSSSCCVRSTSKCARTR